MSIEQPLPVGLETPHPRPLTTYSEPINQQPTSVPKGLADLISDCASGSDTNSDQAVPNPPVSSTIDVREALAAFVKKTEKADLQELAQTYLGIEKKENRKQDESELLQITIEHFSHQLNGMGWGAHLMIGVAHAYTGTHWMPQPDADLRTILGGFAEKMGIPPVTARAYGFMDKLPKQFGSRLRADSSPKDESRVLINLLNGTLEIHEGQENLRAFDKADQLIYQLPFMYDPVGKCPRFEQYLNRVLPDMASQMVIAEFFGWVFIRGLKLEKMLVLYGDGANGKSVLYDVINALLGPKNVSNLSLKSLSKMENRFQLANALLNFGSEINDTCETSVFKRLASGETVEARKLYKDVFEMSDYARLAFNTNVLPKNAELTNGFFRRLLIVPFSETIGDAEKDPKLAQKLIATELPGIFNWVMEGMRRVYAQKAFTHCEASEQVLITYRKESDTAALFLDDEHWGKSDGQTVTKQAFYVEYRGYCKSAGLPNTSKIKFGKRLLSHGIQEGKSGSTRFWFLAKKPPASVPESVPVSAAAAG